MNFCVGIEGEIEGEKEAALLAYYALLLQEKKDCNWNANKDLCSVRRMCCYWSNASKVACEVSSWRFLAGWYSMVGRPVEDDHTWIETLIENSLCYTLLETADILEITVSSIENHLHHLSYVHCFDVWVPHKLNQKNLDHISSCDSLLKCNKMFSLKTLWQAMKSGYPIIKWGYEKWILYNHVEQKRSWRRWNEPLPTTPKTGLHPKKVMCIWWDWESSIMSSFQKTEQLIPTSTAPSLTNWKQHLLKSIQN